MAKILVLGSHAESIIIFRYDFLQELAKKYEVIAASPVADTDSLTDACIAKLALINVRFEPIAMKRTGLNPFYDLGTIYKLYKLYKRIKPDKVFAYNAKPVVFGSIAARLAGVKQIYSMISGLGSYFIHKDLKSRLVNLVMSFLYKIALSFNTKVFFQNPDDVADFASAGIFKDIERTIITNGSGVNISYFDTLPLPDNKITFLLTARFIQAKGVIEYLKAAELIKQQYPNVEFLLVGWHESKDEAISADYIQEYIDKQVVTNLGKLDDVRTALAKTSVFVLPSYREGTPKTVLEAMACGRAVIVSDVPGCRETVVDGDNGLLIEARNTTSLRDAMDKFIINPTMIAKMGGRGRAIAVEKYDVNKVNQTICKAMEY